jgi:hypothetical protein
MANERLFDYNRPVKSVTAVQFSLLFYVAVHSLKYATLCLQSDVDFNLLLGSNDKEHDRGSLKESTGNESDALLGRLIRRLTAVIVTHLPSFWRLAISIFNGKFAKVIASLHKSSSMGFNNREIYLGRIMFYESLFFSFYLLKQHRSRYLVGGKICFGVLEFTYCT